MAGGHATQSGIALQNSVAAVVSAHILAEAAIPLFDVSSAPIRLHVETTSPVDDLVVELADGGLCFVNVKKGVRTSDDPGSPLGSVVEQFVRQWLAGRSAMSGAAGDNPWRPNSDRLILVTAGDGGNTLATSLAEIAARLKSDAGSDITAVATTAAQQRVLGALTSLISQYWTRHTSERPSSAQITALLRLVRIVRFDPAGVDRAPTLALIRQTLAREADDAEQIWNALVEQCQSLAQHRASADRGWLRQAISNSGIRLRADPSVAEDIARLEEYTRASMAHLQHLARLTVPTEGAEADVEIHRESITALVKHASTQSLLVIGLPGSGKSGAIHSAAFQLQSTGHPVVVIPVDRHPVSTVAELGRSIGLHHSIADVLAGWTAARPGVLFIDALDASRGGASDRVFQDFVRSVLSQVAGWHVVCSIREFDLRFGITYRQLFAGVPPDDRFKHGEFARIRHLAIPALTDGELAQVWASSPEMRVVYADASPTLRSLLRSPFNLFLLASVLRIAQVPADRLAAISTQVDLLDLYWSYRVIEEDLRHRQRERLLVRIASKMIESQALSVGHALADANDDSALHELLSNGVLTQVAGYGDQLTELAFSHHVLFDYSVARLLFERGGSATFAAELTASDDRALLLAPAAMLAFRMLWEGDTQRVAFWSRSMLIAGAEGAGAFCRMLPARVAAEATEYLSDWDPLFASLVSSQVGKRAPAEFLVRHCFGAIATGVVPRARVVGDTSSEWCRIARTLSEVALEANHFAVRLLINYCTEEPSSLTHQQALDLAICGKLLLKRSKQAGRNDEGGISVGIRVLARTLRADPEGNCDALRMLLEPSNVLKCGHSEFFSLSQEFECFRAEPVGRRFLAAFYRAAYCTPLPDAREETTLGNSRILPLRSNKRQDFESARHQLGEHFGEFFKVEPALATEVVIDTLECYERVRFDSDAKSPTLIPFGDRTVKFERDHSYMWTDFRGSDALVLFAGFRSGIVQLLQDGRVVDVEAILTIVQDKNRLAAIWRALIEAAAAFPTTLGMQLAPLLESEVVLEAGETRKQAGDMLRTVHPLLDVASRVRVEQAVLRTEREHTQKVLLGCLAPENMAHGLAIQRRAQLAADGPFPENSDPFSIESGWSRGERDWWLKEQGVDLDSKENAELNDSITTLQNETMEARNRATDVQFSASAWECASLILAQLRARTDVPGPLRMKAWDALAEAADRAALTSDTPNDLSRFVEIEAMVFGALDPANWPEPIADQEAEDRFAQSPSWSSPAPRIAGSAALMSLARAQGQPSERYAELIHALARDPVPAVRHQILARINLLFKAAPDLMWELVNDTFVRERNAGVMHFFLSAVSRVIDARPQWLGDELLKLEQSVGKAPEGTRHDLREEVIQLLLRVWFRFDVASAGARLQEFVGDPIRFEDQTLVMVTALRQAVTIGDIGKNDPIDERIRDRTRSLLHSIVVVAVSETSSFTEGAATPEKVARVQTAIRILDRVATELYFGSGAYSSKQADVGTDIDGPADPKHRRFLQEFGPTLEVLADAPYPSITHHLLETLEAFIPLEPERIFRIVVRALVQGGRMGGYQYESLGVGTFVQIVRRYLAEFRFVFSGNDESRKGLIAALDIFVEVGWPEARRLVYDLPEMLR